MEKLLKSLQALNEELKKAKTSSGVHAAREAVKFEKNGQWKLDKADPVAPAAKAKTLADPKAKAPADPKDKAKVKTPAAEVPAAEAPAADPAAAALAEDPVVKFEKNGQWRLEADQIKPGRENSRKIPKEQR